MKSIHFSVLMLTGTTPPQTSNLSKIHTEWTFNDQGQICRFRCTGDFSEAEVAFRG